MAITRQVITSLQRDGTDALGTRTVAMKIVDESIVSGSLLTVESNHFCILKSRGAVLNVYETGQYALQTPDKTSLWVSPPLTGVRRTCRRRRSYGYGSRSKESKRVTPSRSRSRTMRARAPSKLGVPL